MKVSIDRSALLAAIQNVQRSVSTKTTIPVLSGIKLSAERDTLKLTATDLETGIETGLPAHIENQQIVQIMEEGAIVLSARYLSEIVRKLPQSEVELEVKQNYLTIIRSGSSEFNLHGLHAEEFPKLPQVSGSQTFGIPAIVLKDMIRQTVPAVSSEEIRPVLTGVVAVLQEGRLRFVATDSHRLAQRIVNVEAPAELAFSNVIIPGKSLSELGRLLPDNDSLVDVVIADNQIMFKFENTQFYSRLIDGQYPDTSRIIPTSFKTRIQVGTKELLDAVDRAALIARDNDNNVVRLNIRAGQSEISSNSADVGKVTESIHFADFQGEELLIAFNAKYLIDALRVVESESITVEFTGSMSPFLIKQSDNPDYIHLILPVRIY
ncbi:DNA polymerase III subunit beta [Effusibacillus lacus]|uniref:Beta sliding clamp n=1 Tax=Effusibacillus lacus TaxID=1348429 RepID=A0A292YC34_9BACL|nr:DNA polymerase III subunit beta [Effusibacillus lacus]TCS74404.1 DNA polymerase III beta subunit [Effusibacillus lacus]GAX88722.1 DNA polymerase III subunit beta [Effusibacillus lacus]